MSSFRSSVFALQCILSTASLQLQEKTWSLLSNFEKCESNPFRGFTAVKNGIHTDFPVSVEHFYTKLSDIVVGKDTYDWSIFENRLTEVAASSHHSVARFYLEWPGSATAVPQYLIDDGLYMFNYSDNLTPNYSDPRLQQCILDFISELRTEYDGDQRLWVLQLGLLGYWGEWHLYPNTQLLWDKTLESQVLEAFSLFTNTALQMRYASDVEEQYQTEDSAKFGYHDDSFGYSTLGENSWFEYPNLVNYGLENVSELASMGGEVRHGVNSFFADDYQVSVYAQNFTECMFTMGTSYMKSRDMFENYDYLSDANYKARVLWNHRRMGYALVLDSVSVAPLSADEFSLELDISNRGSAPFYLPTTLWVEFVSPETGDVILERGWLLESPLSLDSETYTLSISTESVDKSLLHNADMWLQLEMAKQYADNAPVFCNAQVNDTVKALLIEEALIYEEDEDGGVVNVSIAVVFLATALLSLLILE